MKEKLEIEDIVQLKKQHPCGNKDFEIMRTGADFRIKCLKCEKQIWLARTVLEKRVKKIVKSEKS